MLSKFDDYPIHQTSHPLRQPVSADRHHYDRYWFNGYDRDGEFYFGIGAALYPNLGIMDCGVSHRARRRAARVPRVAARADRAERARGGPVLDRDPRADEEPARHASRENDTGFSCDLLWIPRTANFKEGHQASGGAGTRRAAHGGDALQPVRLLAGRDPLRRAHLRDRSAPRATARRTARGACGRSAAPRRARRPRACRRSSSCGRRCSGRTAARTRASSRTSSARCGTGTACSCPPTRTPRRSPASRIRAPSRSRASRSRSSTSRARAARSARRSRCIERGGARQAIELEPLLCFRMKGIGYSHPTWGHGMWKGELAYAAESWKVADVDETALENQHIQQVVRATCGDRVGRRRARADLPRAVPQVRLQGVPRHGALSRPLRRTALRASATARARCRT